ncbi:MAG: methylenetetrahydrofolate reductase [NAD(P)H] [Chitinophagales bacterium]|nr:methylenetetrahydrofolate reductase [NAD(P)H] [Chitinophagales bacterium]
MKVTEHIERAKGKTLFSLEIVPPLKGKSIFELYQNIDPLMEFNPPFIDVTTSREEFIFIEKDNGLLEKKTTRMRPGTLGICASIQHRYNVDVVPHVLCGGFTKEETEYLLIDCQYVGIDNIMALRGDAMKHQRRFEPTEGGHHFASDLIQHIHRFNEGNFLYGCAEKTPEYKFCIGVAAYPEKHIEAPSLEVDLKRLKKKVELGADYVVTQMFFDNNKYFEFVDKAREIGITIPIIPGLKPIAIKEHLKSLPQTFKLDIPDELIKAVEKCKDNKEVRQVGIEWSIQQSRKLKAANVPVIHYYTMGKSDNIYAIAKEVF